MEWIRPDTSAIVWPLPHEKNGGAKTLEAILWCDLDFDGRYAYPSDVLKKY